MSNRQLKIALTVYSCLTSGLADSESISFSSRSWMGDIFSSEFRQHTPLNRMVIPGSHNSGSFGMRAHPGKLAHRYEHIPLIGFATRTIAKWGETQSTTLRQQLTDGVRYLDLRIEEDKGQFYFAHGLLTHKISVLLGDILQFVEQQDTEIVLIRLKINDKDIDTKEFQRFIHTMISTLSEKVIRLDDCSGASDTQTTCSPASSYKELVSHGNIILILHSMHKIQKDSAPFFWPESTSTTSSYTRGFASKKGLYKHLRKVVPEGHKLAMRHKTFYVEQHVLTPDDRVIEQGSLGLLLVQSAYRINRLIEGLHTRSVHHDYLTINRITDLKKLNDTIKHYTLGWIREHYQLGTPSNIVLTDFSTEYLTQSLISFNVTPEADTYLLPLKQYLLYPVNHESLSVRLYCLSRLKKIQIRQKDEAPVVSGQGKEQSGN